MNRTLLFIILIVILGMLTFWLIKTFPGALNERESQIQLVSGLALLSYFSLMIFSRRFETFKSLRYLFAWAGIGLVILIMYSYKDTLLVIKTRLVQQLSPSSPQVIDDNAVSFSIAEGGHFYIDANVNNTRTRFLLDSGASTVVLTRKDAERAGIFVNELDFTVPTMTANGMVYSAPVVISQIEIGSIIMNNVKAMVSRNELNQSLLGMSFLSRLKSWRVEDKQLILEK